MNPANIRHSATATRSGGVFFGVLLALGPWLLPAVLTVNAATGGTMVAWGDTPIAKRMRPSPRRVG